MKTSTFYLALFVIIYVLIRGTMMIINYNAYKVESYELIAFGIGVFIVGIGLVLKIKADKKS